MQTCHSAVMMKSHDTNRNDVSTYCESRSSITRIPDASIAALQVHQWSPLGAAAGRKALWGGKFTACLRQGTTLKLHIQQILGIQRCLPLSRKTWFVNMTLWHANQDNGLRQKSTHIFDLLIDGVPHFNTFYHNIR